MPVLFFAVRPKKISPHDFRFCFAVIRFLPFSFRSAAFRTNQLNARAIRSQPGNPEHMAFRVWEQILQRHDQGCERSSIRRTTVDNSNLRALKADAVNLTSGGLLGDPHDFSSRSVVLHLRKVNREPHRNQSPARKFPRRSQGRRKLDFQFHTSTTCCGSSSMKQATNCNC